jgi:hypothetical protein
MIIFIKLFGLYLNLIYICKKIIMKRSYIIIGGVLLSIMSYDFYNRFNSHIDIPISIKKESFDSTKTYNIITNKNREIDSLESIIDSLKKPKIIEVVKIEKTKHKKVKNDSIVSRIDTTVKDTIKN